MKVINLRLHYPHYQQDKLVEVSEEVFDVLCQSVREMRNYERRKRYHRAFYSLDAFDWTENYWLSAVGRRGNRQELFCWLHRQRSDGAGSGRPHDELCPDTE